MKILAPIALALVLATLTTTASAQPPPLPALLPRRAAINAPAGDLVRLPLPAEVLAASRPDLSDVRVVDSTDHEIAYLVDRGDRPMPRDPSPALSLVPIEASRQRTRAGSVDRYAERFVVLAPGAPPARATWVLRVDAMRPRFVTTVRAIALEADGTEREIARGSFFRIGTPLRERLELSLPDLTADRVRLELEGEDGFLEPRLELYARRDDAIPPRHEVPLAIAETRSEAGRTIVLLDPPVGVRPERIRIETSTASLARAVEVTAIDRDRGRRFLGSATIVRVENVAGAEALEVELARGGGDRIEIAIHDGDSPPLADLSVIAIARAPSLIFEGREAVMLRFGGGRVRAPRYDLEALAGTTLGEELLDRRISGDATLGPIEDEPAFDPAPALSFAMHAGAAVDRTRSRSTATLTIPASREGLSRLVAPADLLAASSSEERPSDLRDLRVLDAEGRQWPYLVSADVETIDVPLELGPPVTDGGEEGWSERTARIPHGRIAAAAIVLSTPAALVDRDVVVITHGEHDEEIEIGRGTIRRRPGEEPSLEIATSDRRVEDLVIRVYDGSEEPLAIEGATARVRSHALFFVAPAGTYTVHVGDDEASAPAYEIARARELIVAVEPAEASLGPVAPNPAYREPGLFERAGTETIAVWIALVLAVIVLGLLTLRVARSAPEPESTPAPPAQDPPPAAPVPETPPASE